MFKSPEKCSKLCSKPVHNFLQTVDKMFKTRTTWDMCLLAVGIPVQNFWDIVETVQSFEHLNVQNSESTFSVLSQILRYNLGITDIYAKFYPNLEPTQSKLPSFEHFLHPYYDYDYKIYSSLLRKIFFNLQKRLCVRKLFQRYWS